MKPPNPEPAKSAGPTFIEDDYALALALDIANLRQDRTVADRAATALHARASRSDHTHWNTGSFSRWMEDPFETSAVALDALIAHDANDPVLPDALGYFIANKTGDRWNSTKATAMVLYAMTHYVRARKMAGGAASLTVSTAGSSPVVTQYIWLLPRASCTSTGTWNVAPASTPDCATVTRSCKFGARPFNVCVIVKAGMPVLSTH